MTSATASSRLRVDRLNGAVDHLGLIVERRDSHAGRQAQSSKPLFHAFDDAPAVLALQHDRHA